MEVLTPSLLRRWLERDRPVLTGLSATFLYDCAREVGDEVLVEDDLRGVIDEKVPEGEVRVTVIATGFHAAARVDTAPAPREAVRPLRAAAPAPVPMPEREPEPEVEAARIEPRDEPVEMVPAEEDDHEPVIRFPEILASGNSMIEFEEDPEESDEPVIMDNGSIRSFNPEVFRVPTFVRKQMD
jgi:hypothetical protein